MSIEVIRPEPERMVSADQETVQLGAGFGSELGPSEGPLWWKEESYLLSATSAIVEE